MEVFRALWFFICSFYKRFIGMTEAVNHTLEQLRLGEPQQFRNLCVVPIFDDGPSGPTYQTLTEALKSKQVTVTEVSEGGAVPNLKVANLSDQPLVLVDGEELVGAKQNRIANTTMMLEPNSETVIPVSCTEAGRWRYNSRHFQDSGVIMAAKARYNKSERLMHNLKMRAKYDAGQSGVWKDIDELHRKSGSHSRTQAMRDAYVQREREMNDYLQAFPLQPGQQGMVVFLNGRAVGADYLSRPEAYVHLHDKLLKSHVIEAVSEKAEQKDEADWSIDAHLFLQALAQAEEVSTHQPVGLGTDYRFAGERAKGAALVYDDSIIHLSSYAKEMVDTEEAAPFAERRRAWERMQTRRQEQQRPESQEEPPAPQREEDGISRFRDRLWRLFR